MHSWTGKQMVYLFSDFLLTGVSCNALYHLFTVVLEIKLTLQQADGALIYCTGTYQQLREAVWVQAFFIKPVLCHWDLQPKRQRLKFYCGIIFSSLYCHMT